MRIANPTKNLIDVTDKATGYYGYGTNLKAKNPKPTHKYVQHLKNMRDAGYATRREVCPGVKHPIDHEFAQFCRLGLAKKFTNLKGTRTYFKITPKGRRLLKQAGV